MYGYVFDVMGSACEGQVSVVGALHCFDCHSATNPSGDNAASESAYRRPDTLCTDEYVEN